MHQSELDGLIEAGGIIRELWPEWTPTDEQRRTWAYKLRQEEYADVVKAAREHHADVNWRAPRLPGVLKHLREIKARRQREHPREVDPNAARTGVYVQCVEGARLGTFFEMCYSARREERPSPDKIVEQAGRIADRHAKLYGGDWEVIREANHLQMLERRQDLLVTAAQAAGEQKP